MLLILVVATIGYLVAGWAGAAVGVLAAICATARREAIRHRRALRRCAEDAAAALRGVIQDAPGLGDAVRALGYFGPPSPGEMTPPLRLPSGHEAASVLAQLLAGSGDPYTETGGYAALSRRFSAMEREVVNVLGGPETLIVVPAARQRRVGGHVIGLTSPVSVGEALEALKFGVWEAGADAADEIREQIEALIQPSQPDMARRFADEVGNYYRGIMLLKALHESKAFGGPLRSGTETVFDATRFLDYLFKRRETLGSDALPNTWRSLLRGARMGAVVGWRADALKSPLLWLGEPMMILALIAVGAAIGFLAAGFTGAAVGVLVALLVTIWANS